MKGKYIKLPADYNDWSLSFPTIYNYIFAFTSFARRKNEIHANFIGLKGKQYTDEIHAICSWDEWAGRECKI